MGEQEPERELKMQGLKHNRIQEFKYLGSTVQSDGDQTRLVRGFRRGGLLDGRSQDCYATGKYQQS